MKILYFSHRTHVSDVREWRYHVTAWRTSCLYGVTYSRASPRLPDVAPSSVPIQFAHLRCASGEGLSCHRMAHFVLIRCFPQPCISDAPRCRTFFSTDTVCTSPMCEWGGAIMSPHGALRAYTVLPTAVRLRRTLMV